MRASKLSAGRRGGLTILELLVVSAILSILFGLIIPAIAATREVARKLECQNRLRQLGLALYSYSDRFGGLPPGWQYDPGFHSAYGWALAVAPDLELGGVAQQVDASQGLEIDLNNDQLPLKSYLCPSDVGPPIFMLYAEVAYAGGTEDVPLVLLPRANYVGLFGTHPPDEFPGLQGEGTFIEARSIRWADITQGPSHVALVSERTSAKLFSSWLGFDIRGEDTKCRVSAFNSRGPNLPDADECELDSRHPGGINMLMGDGRVEFIQNSIDRQVYQRMAIRSQ
jgi:prepilin-type processing-associated H-X9-DG protein